MVPFSHVHEQFLRGLLACRSWIVIFMVTDLFGTKQRFNVPGAVADSNWSERISLPVSSWKDNKALASLLNRLSPDLQRK
jgi:4-alpha-glucanotransferase